MIFARTVSTTLLSVTVALTLTTLFFNEEVFAVGCTLVTLGAVLSIINEKFAGAKILEPAGVMHSMFHTIVPFSSIFVWFIVLLPNRIIEEREVLFWNVPVALLKILHIVAAPMLVLKVKV